MIDPIMAMMGITIAGEMGVIVEKIGIAVELGSGIELNIEVFEKLRGTGLPPGFFP